MKLAIMQPYLFPYLGYFHLIHAADKFVFYDDVNFIKNGWINRNRLLLAGSPHYFTVPLAGASPFAAIKDVKFETPGERWKRKMRATFEQAYKAAAHRDDGLRLLDTVLSSSTDSIADLARSSVRAVLEYLGLRRDVVDTAQGYKNDALKGQDRILDICRREAATTYVNLPGGRGLYDSGAFRSAGIDLRFIDSQFPPYSQGSGAFVPGLSILDAVMHCPPAEIRGMLEQYALTK
jgi:WbqC-like protein